MAGTLAVSVALYGFTTASTVPTSALSLWLASGLAVPLWLVALRPHGVLAVGLAVAALMVPLALRTAELVEQPGPPQEAAHDGGVHVTRAAADDLLLGRNPYSESFGDELPSSWLMLRVVPDTPTPNPVVDRMPYLPAAFLVAVPGVVLERVTGFGADPRWPMGMFIAGAVLALARRPEPGWARGAAIMAFGSSFVVIYAAWGTNDAAAAALLTLAALGTARRPGWAGAALALAVAYKAPLALALVPWVVWLVHRGGWAALRPWWTAPALLAVTTLPFLAWSPGDLLDDTLWFWAGRGDVPFPASGLGLGYRWPGLMEGLPGALVTLAFLVGALAAAVALARRVDHVGILPVSSALALLGLLIPARTFQRNYLALVAGLLAAGWLVVGAHLGTGDDEVASEATRVGADRAP